jgi:TrmH family RNA methyltransferase
MSVRLIIVSPMHASNIGSIARLAGNFGVSDVVVVSPRCDVFSSEAFALATVHARSVLEAFQIKSSLAEAIEGAQYVIGFSRRVGDLRRPDLGWSDLPSSVNHQGRVDLVFGPEDTGLLHQDLTLCSAVCTLPTQPGVPSMNLSQSVAVVLAGALWNQLSKDDEKPVIKTRFEAEKPLSAEGLRHLVAHWRQSMVDIGLTNDGNPDRLLHYFHRILNRSGLSEREANMLRGFLSQIQMAVGTRQLKKRLDE